MDYQAIYDRIIKRNRNTPRIKKQTEDHHIIPRSFAKLDGIQDINGSWNRVNLPLREHFIAHLLLARIWRGHIAKGPRMAKAFKMMSTNGRYNSRKYTWLKLNYSHSEETKQRISKKRKIEKPQKKPNKKCLLLEKEDLLGIKANQCLMNSKQQLVFV